MQHDFSSSEESSARWRGLFVQALRKVLTLFVPSFALFPVFTIEPLVNELVLKSDCAELKSRVLPVTTALHSCR